MVSLASRRSRTALAPFLLLGPAVAWLLALSLSYVVHDFLCAAAETAGESAPVGPLRVGIVALNVLLLAVTVAAGILAFFVYRQARRRTDDRTGDRTDDRTGDRTDEPEGALAGPAQFVGAAGIGMAVLFGFGIVLIATTPVVVGAC